MERLADRLRETERKTWVDWQKDLERQKGRHRETGKLIDRHNNALHGYNSEITTYIPTSAIDRIVAHSKGAKGLSWLWITILRPTMELAPRRNNVPALSTLSTGKLLLDNRGPNFPDKSPASHLDYYGNFIKQQSFHNNCVHGQRNGFRYFYELKTSNEHKALRGSEGARERERRG